MIKHDKALRIIFYIIISITGLGSAYTSYPTLAGPYGFFIFKINDILFYCILGSLVLFFAYLLNQSRIFYQKIENKNNKRILIKGSILFSLLTIDRVFCNGILFYYQNYFNYVPELIVTLIITTFISIHFLRYPNFLESFNIYLNLKALYVIKNNGHLIYSYNFFKQKEQELITQRSILLGGIIFAVTRGLPLSLETEKEIKSLDFGNQILIFGSGKEVFGVLEGQANSKILENKLKEFISRFEELYLDDLKNWTGLINKFSNEGTNRIVKEIFGE